MAYQQQRSESTTAINFNELDASDAMLCRCYSKILTVIIGFIVVFLLLFIRGFINPIEIQKINSTDGYNPFIDPNSKLPPGFEPPSHPRFQTPFVN